MEKSPLAIITMLGIMKAGATFVPLEPAHPVERRRAIVQQLDISSDIFSDIKESDAIKLPQVSPESTAYVLFTSGSTESRILQFSSFVFDVSIAEIFGALMFGGTLFLPSDSERLAGISGFIQENNINTAMLTTSFAKTLNPDIIPSLRTLVLVDHVAVDVIKRDSREMLAAFINFSDTSIHGDIKNASTDPALVPINDTLRDTLASMVSNLTVRLPGYMIPTVFFPITRMPFNNSLKLDRRKLLQIVELVTADEIVSFSVGSGFGSNGVKSAPTTKTEILLSKTWAAVLGINNGNIGKEDTFTQLGGDSITAIQLVSAAQQGGINISASDVFQHPRLLDMAACIDAKSESEVTSNSKDDLVEPFSLLPSDISREMVVRDAAELCDIPTSSISDVLPCTPLQEGLMALSETQPGSYLARFALKLPEGVNLTRFRASIERMYEVCPNLRTRIILFQDTEPIQVIIDEKIAWREFQGIGNSLSDVLEQTQATMDWSPGFGKPLCMFSIVQDDSRHSHFVWDIHHSIYDGWSIGLMLDIARRAYFDSSIVQPVPFANYVKYIKQSSDEESSRSYWHSRFAGVKVSHFPKSPEHFNTSNEVDTPRDASMTRHLSLPAYKSLPDGITLPTILRSAWALVLSKYLETNDVVFGNTVTGRNARVPGIVNLVGPTIGTLPIRVQIHKDDEHESTVRQFLIRMQEEAREMIPHEHVGLQSIAQMGKETRDACDFQNLLVIQPRARIQGFNDSSAALTEDRADVDFTKIEDLTSSSTGNAQRYHVYPLVFQCIIESPESIRLLASHDAHILSSAQMDAMCHHFSQAVTQLVTATSSSAAVALSSIRLTSRFDIQAAVSWASEPARQTETWDACVHDIISKRATRFPSREAIFSFDGCMTYSELENASSRFAEHLSKLGVGPETLVPICFEKSLWTIVAMLGIMKAGGAFVPLDPVSPINRTKALIKDMGNVEIIVASASTTASCVGLCTNIVTLSNELLTHLPPLSKMPVISKASPTNVAYVIFTSGSTGTPKGVIVEHRSLCSSIQGHGTDIGLDKDSRVLQFSNYVFDVSLGEILSTLVFGGTVCVPSDTERLSGSGLVGFIAQSSANVAFLTPSVVATLSPEEVPSLKTLVLGGEAPTRENLQTWYGKVNVLNGYGPAEACIYCSVSQFTSPTDRPTIVGRGSNFKLWVVDVNDSSRLSPVGCVGEILLEGPGLARGYLNPAASSAAFIHLESSDWLDCENDITNRRFYKTGDLARCHVDGCIEYMGRKDNQIKLHGQRIELGEIEYQAKSALALQGSSEPVVIDLVRTGGREALVAIVSLGSIKTADEDAPVMMMMMTETLRNKFGKLASELSATLPLYMVPQYYILVSQMPTTSSGKIHRKGLREHIESLTALDLKAYFIEPSALGALNRGAADTNDFRPPTTPIEASLRDIWSRILNLPIDSIGIDDNFYHLGGDSIRVITMAKRIKQEYDVALGLGHLAGKETTIAKLAAVIKTIHKDHSS
ncbi:hypothetical protein RJ55_04884 [Drechmeria coniospora]|nr:hypothetical protein RJ55_04884 [Drechmeria coniospora]